jgi:drug/metabolite transporter, DME family
VPQRPEPRTRITTKTRARLQVCAAAALFSTAGAGIKLCGLSGWQVASFRAGVAAPVLWLFMRPKASQWSWAAILVGVAYAVQLTLFVAGNKLTTAANTIFLQSTAPLYILVLAPLLLREWPRRRDLGFAATLAVGLALFFVTAQVATSTAPNPLLGNALAAGGGLAWALTVTGLRWASRDGATAAGPALVAGNVIAFLGCLPAALPVRGGTPVDWLLILYLGIFQVALAYRLLSAGMRHVAAFEASLLLLLEPVLNPIWAWVVHGERPGPWSLAGGALILGATVAKTWVDTRATGASRLAAASDGLDGKA